MKKSTKLKIKKIEDIGSRALKTFLQGFLASLIYQMGNISNLDKTLLKSILIGAIASGLSALMNFVNNLIGEMK